MSTLIRHGHAHGDIWNVYTMDEVRAYYTESRIYDVQLMKDAALSSRVSQAEKKGWSDFTKSLDKSTAALRAEIEDEVIEGDTVIVKGGKRNIDSFFKGLMSIPKVASTKAARKPKE